MQLKLQRSQRTNTWGGVIFCLDIRAGYSREEADNINKYRLAGLLVYSSQTAQQHRQNAQAHLARAAQGSPSATATGLAKGLFSAALAKMALNVTVGSLGKGHHIECKDMHELLEAEETLRTSCKNITAYLDVAATFNGSEIIIDYKNGEEQVQIAQNAPPLLNYAAVSEPVPAIAPPVPPLETPLWLQFENWAIGSLQRQGWVITPGGFRWLCVLVAVFLILAGVVFL